MQGIDNGWIKFEKYCIPKESLLNKFADICPDGGYSSKIASKSKLMAIQFGSLSGGRIAIAQVSNDCALVYAGATLRYWAVRKQFKNSKAKQETRLLDYSINHYRLITKFATHFVQNVGMTKITEFWDEYLDGGLGPDNTKASFSHLISSVAKSVFTWTTYDTMSEARQGMGGYGFSSYNGFGSALPVMDLNRTWEGDNNVLMQQAGKLILQNLAYLFTDKPLMKTFEFLTMEVPEPKPFIGNLNSITQILELMTFRAITLIHETGTKLQSSEDKVAAWDRLLAFDTYPMTFAYFYRFILSNYIDFISQFDNDLKTKEVFERIGLIYGQNIIIEDAEFFRDCLSRAQINELKEKLMDNLQLLRKEVVALSYLAPVTDKMMSGMAKHDMKPYENFLDAVEKAERTKNSTTDGDIYIDTSQS